MDSPPTFTFTTDLSFVKFVFIFLKKILQIVCIYTRFTKEALGMVTLRGLRQQDCMNSRPAWITEGDPVP